jgi:hypothetical protein
MLSLLIIFMTFFYIESTSRRGASLKGIGNHHFLLEDTEMLTCCLRVDSMICRRVTTSNAWAFTCPAWRPSSKLILIQAAIQDLNRDLIAKDDMIQQVRIALAVTTVKLITLLS